VRACVWEGGGGGGGGGEAGGANTHKHARMPWRMRRRRQHWQAHGACVRPCAPTHPRALRTCQPYMMASASSRPPQPPSVPRMSGAAATPGYSCTPKSTCVCAGAGRAARRGRVVLSSAAPHRSAARLAAQHTPGAATRHARRAHPGDHELCAQQHGARLGHQLCVCVCDVQGVPAPRTHAQCCSCQQPTDATGGCSLSLIVTPAHARTCHEVPRN
jgi:hypothetical protein